ncbi:MAG TPA: GNAT family N-acetyltransferase [Phycisphaerae bacterium]|nr:GNAT family N-acetyltransferase [Phycisphaerae bacterium]
MAESDSAEVDVQLTPELRYTENVREPARGLPARLVRLWRNGAAEDVSQATLLSFDIRFGQTAIATEGYQGVQTPPEHRQQGYVRHVMEESLSRAGQRVDVAFLFGIERLYGKFGFVTCLPAAHLVVPIRRVEQAEPLRSENVRPMREGDLPEMLKLYNRQHAGRPWTVRRGANHWDRLPKPQIWQAGGDVRVLEKDGRLCGYMVLQADSYGWDRGAAVLEMTAKDVGSARGLLAAAGARYWEQRRAEFEVYEPADSIVGRVARQMGCDVRATYRPDGGGMAAILNRESLVGKLEPELARRAQVGRVKPTVSAVHALAAGKLCPDDGVLLRLLLGYWSWVDAAAAGLAAPAKWRDAFAAWFPGACAALPSPYAHRLDHY